MDWDISLYCNWAWRVAAWIWALEAVMPSLIQELHAQVRSLFRPQFEAVL